MMKKDVNRKNHATKFFENGGVILILSPDHFAGFGKTIQCNYLDNFNTFNDVNAILYIIVNMSSNVQELH